MTRLPHEAAFMRGHQDGLIARVPDACNLIGDCNYHYRKGYAKGIEDRREDFLAQHVAVCHPGRDCDEWCGLE